MESHSFIGSQTPASATKAVFLPTTTIPVNWLWEGTALEAKGSFSIKSDNECLQVPFKQNVEANGIGKIQRVGKEDIRV